MEVGTEFQCEIEKCVFGGDALTRVNGEVVFISGALPGEKLIGKVTAVKKNFSRASIVRFGSTNAHRQEPFCPYFGRCPGCCYQHVDYAYETELKAAQLDDLLCGAGITPGRILPPIAPEPERGYRNKIVMHTHKVGNEIFFGYVMGDNTTVTDITECPLARPEINAELTRLRGDRSFMHSLHEKMDVTLRYTQYAGVSFWRNAPARNATWLREATPFGELSVPCGSFFQVNPGGGAALTDEFTRILDHVKPDSVIDLYAGAGLFGCCAAAHGISNVWAVESDEAAATAARYNLAKFGVKSPRVIAGDAADALKEIKDAGGSENALLVVDPPRGGLTLRAAMCLTGSSLRHFVYISCNPATWARDAVRLRKGGFEPAEIRLVNMFPRTEHFELFSYWTRG